MSDDRAVSSVLGVVMILGITLAAVTSLMVIGGMALQQSQEEAELSRMETSMAQMSSKASLTALGDAGSQHFDLGELRGGELKVRETTGSVTIERWPGGEEENAEVIVSSTEFGALVYEKGDHEVAYQGGGVWKLTEDGSSEMISPPEYHYRGETLTFPLINVTGEGSLDGSGTVEFVDSTSMYPIDDLENPEDNATIHIVIESDYHHGWYSFFDKRTEGPVNHSVEDQIVRANLSAMYASEFNSPIAAQEFVEERGNAGDIEGAEEGQRYPSASGDIDARIDACDQQDEEDLKDFNETEDSYQGGYTYCHFGDEQFELTNELTFNTSEGDIEVVLPHGIDLGNNVVTVEGDGSVNMSIDGDVNMAGDSEIKVEDGDASNFGMFLHSDDTEFDSSGGPTIMGIIYAPGSEVRFGGNVDHTGTVIADTFTAAGNIDVEYDESLNDYPLDFDHGTDEFQFLHITENTIKIE